MVAVRIAPDIRFVVIGSSTYLAERGLPLHPSQLEKHDCINIRLSPTGPLYGWEFVRQGEIVKKVDGQLTFSSIYPMLQAVKDGYGRPTCRSLLPRRGLRRDTIVGCLRTGQRLFPPT
ncbi:type 2 periplasmic-binding domain-containing protein [Enterobacter hormaechei]|uniref:LysR family transcriptional regulator n=1 Tax=Enterobacter hormaechei TaxID=158836 RepID=UPI00388D270E